MRGERKMSSKQVFSLQKDNDTEYVLFIVRGKTVEYRHFEYYTGPTIEERRAVPIEEARAKYRAMLSNGWHVR